MQKSLHFLYHEIRPAVTAYAYVTPLAEFEAHCALFANRQSHEKEFALRPEITFDDGHSSDAAYALPVLTRFGLRATFFITAGWTAERPGFMDWAELRQLLDAGHRIGAHGSTHKLLTACSDAELQEELGGARQRLEEKLGTSITTMSLPGGRTDARVQKACKAAGYTQVFTSHPRPEAMETHPATVGRLNLTGGTSPDWLGRVLDPSSGVLAGLERRQRFKAGAQRLLGDRLYARIWAVANRQGTEPVTKGSPT